MYACWAAFTDSRLLSGYLLVFSLSFLVRYMRRLNWLSAIYDRTLNICDLLTYMCTRAQPRLKVGERVDDLWGKCPLPTVVGAGENFYMDNYKYFLVNLGIPDGCTCAQTLKIRNGVVWNLNSCSICLHHGYAIVTGRLVYRSAVSSRA